jgi:hypothetical protein
MDIFRRFADDLRNKRPGEIVGLICLTILLSLSHEAIFHWAVEEIADLFGLPHPSTLKIAAFIGTYAILPLTVIVAVLAVRYQNYLPLFIIYVALANSFSTFHLAADLRQIERGVVAANELHDLEAAKEGIEIRLLYYDRLFQVPLDARLSISPQQLQLLVQETDQIEKQIKFIASTRSPQAAKLINIGLDGVPDPSASSNYKLSGDALRQEYNRLYNRHLAARALIVALLKELDAEIRQHSPSETSVPAGAENAKY